MSYGNKIIERMGAKRRADVRKGEGRERVCKGVESEHTYHIPHTTFHITHI